MLDDLRGPERQRIRARVPARPHQKVAGQRCGPAQQRVSLRRSIGNRITSTDQRIKSAIAQSQHSHSTVTEHQITSTDQHAAGYGTQKEHVARRAWGGMTPGNAGEMVYISKPKSPIPCRGWRPASATCSEASGTHPGRTTQSGQQTRRAHRRPAGSARMAAAPRSRAWAS